MLKFEKKYKDFVLRTIKEAEEEEARNLVFDVLKEYGLQNDEKIDADLYHITSNYKEGIFGVILHESSIIGTFGLKKMDVDRAEINKMYILNEFRGHGLGTFIISNLLEVAKKCKFKSISLETSSVLIQAIGLYKKMGFEEIYSENRTPRCDKQFFKSLNN